MTEKERMVSGQLFMANDKEIRQDNLNAQKLIFKFNQSTREQLDVRTNLLQELFGSVGKNIYIEPTFRCDYGQHISIGDNFYANYDCIILDECKVSIGNNVMFGPRVCLYTATHPIDAEVRGSGLEYGKPIFIGDNVWVGGSSVINPGVTIGNDVIIGAGSVITRDVPDSVIVAGNPGKIVRSITEIDKMHWKGLETEYWKNH